MSRVIHYDAAGRRISRLDTFGGAATANTFGYNARSEVISALMGTNSYGYAYDPIGNRITSRHNFATNLYTANNLNQYTTISNLCLSAPPRDETNHVNPVNPVQENPTPPSAFSYDADGNMTADERGWHYVWNGENRMICASNDEVVVTYAYDHRGRMVWKNISRRDSEPQNIGYVWDGWNIIRETATGLSTFQPFNLSTSYVWGLDIDGTLQGAGGVGGLLAVIRSKPATNNSSLVTRSSSLYFPAYDANGNITEHVATNGDIVAHYEYSAFGEPTVSSGELASSFTHQFSTKPYCAATGFSEYQMRKYRPVLGRWMSRDPVDETIAYCFLGNSPNIKYDYLGLSGCHPSGNPAVVDRISLLYPVGHNILQMKSRLKSWRIVEDTGRIPIIIIIPPGGVIIRRAYCECTCEIWQVYHQFSIECEKRKQPMHCEFSEGCGTTYMDYFEDLGWSGGVVRKKNGESAKQEYKIQSSPGFLSEFDDFSCAAPCALACSIYDKALPSVIWHNSCENLARSLGR